MARPLPVLSAVVEAEAAMAPPNVAEEAAAPAKEGNPNLAPGAAKVKAPTAGGSPGGVGFAAVPDDGASPLPAQQQL